MPLTLEDIMTEITNFKGLVGKQDDEIARLTGRVDDLEETIATLGS